MNITGLFNNNKLSQLISTVTSDIAHEALPDFHEEIVGRLDELNLEQINGILNIYTFESVLNVG